MTKPQWEISFDEQFGKPRNPNDLCEGSDGRIAGCDDCFDNVKQREEYKDFIRSQIEKSVEDMRRKCVEEIEKDIPTNGTREELYHKWKITNLIKNVR